MRSINDLTFTYLPQESQVQVRQLVYNLNQLLQHMNGKEEIFTIGSYSRIIGTELDALNAAKTRRKVQGEESIFRYVETITVTFVFLYRRQPTKSLLSWSTVFSI